MHNETEIAEFIVERVYASQKMSGAHLGSLVDAKFSDFKAQFGKLRAFIQKSCAGRVKVVGILGGGNPIYRALHLHLRHLLRLLSQPNEENLHGTHLQHLAIPVNYLSIQEREKSASKAAKNQNQHPRG